MKETGVLGVDDFMKGCGNIKKQFDCLFNHHVENKIPDVDSNILYQAGWHVAGLFYHLENLFKFYIKISSEVGGRVESSNADVVIMHNPQVQNLMFEFHALINLAKISLDRLRYLLESRFLNPEQLPKSVTKFLKSGTDCPVYLEIIKNREIIDYLIDIRDCLNHYRSFTVKRNVIFKRESTSENEFTEGPFENRMFRGTFRRLLDGRLSINILLPDLIFESNMDNRKLAHFTYDKKINLLSQSFRFVEAIVIHYMSALEVLTKVKKPKFTFKKKP